MRIGLLQLFKLLHQVSAHLGRIVHKLLVLNHVEHRQSRRTRQVVAAKGSAQHAIHRLKFGRDDDCPHRETIANTLGTSNDVRFHAKMLVSKEFARTAVATLYLVANKHRARLVASLAQPLHKIGRGHAYAAHTLNALHNHRSHIALVQFSLKGRQVVEWQESHVAVAVDRCHNFRIVGSLHSQRRAAVKSLSRSQHTFASRVERSQFQGILVSLGPRVNQEQLVVWVAAHLS